MQKFVAYLRVSTAKQGKSGLGLEAQRQMVADYLTRCGGELVLPEFIEIETGKKKQRPVLMEALTHAKKHNAILLVAKLDRLARNVAFVSSLQEAKVPFRACDMPDANEFMVHIIAAVAEYEAKLISERTKAGLEQAKKRGTKLGNRLLIENGHADRWNEDQKSRAKEAADRLLPIIADCQRRGIKTLNGIAKYLNTKGHTTETGGKFYPQTVKRILSRLEAV
jgi:DNA invertase Pin-like site-specific DNA recombinase